MLKRLCAAILAGLGSWGRAAHDHHKETPPRGWNTGNGQGGLWARSSPANRAKLAARARGGA